MLEIDRPFLHRTLTDLVRINSVNPDLAADAPGEPEIARYVAGVLGDLGLEVTVHDAAPGRPSVVGRLAGRGGGPSLMLNAHLDTVAVDGMDDPFSGAVREGRLHGRGSYDMKGGLAAAVAAVKALVDAGRPNEGDLVVAAVADEEFASIGTADLVQRYHTDGAIVTEPTHLDICLAHKGFVWLEILTHGRAAHGSRFDLGIDANMHMGRVLTALETLERELREGPRHRLVGPASLHAATIKGGSGWSTYSAGCMLQVERRTIPGEADTDVVAQVQQRLDAIARADPRVKVELRVVLARPPFEVAEQAPLVRTLAAEASRELGRPAAVVGHTAWMDSAFLAQAGIETVVFGGTGAGAHEVEEWVDLGSIEQLTSVLAHTAVAYGRSR